MSIACGVLTCCGVSSASGEVQQVVSAGGSRFGTDIMEDLKNPKHSGVECDAPTKGAEGCENTVWEQMVELEPGEAGAGPRESRSSDIAHSYPTDVRICTVERCVELDECSFKFSVFLFYTRFVDILRTREEWFWRAVLRHQCSHT